MRKNKAVKNYKAAMSRLSARENPFLEESSQPEAERPSVRPAVTIRRRFGTIAAAAVILCAAAVTVLLWGRLSPEAEKSPEPPSTVSQAGNESEPAGFTNEGDAIEAYSTACEREQEIIAVLDHFLSLGNDEEEECRSAAEKLEPYEEIKQKALEHLYRYRNIGPANYLLDVRVAPKGEIRLTIYNALSSPVTLTGSGKAYTQGDGRKYCELMPADSEAAPVTIEPGEVGEILLNHTLSLKGLFTFELNAEGDDKLYISYDSTAAKEMLTPERQLELLELIEKYK